MKKRLILCLFGMCLLIALPVHSQIQFGLKGGLDVSKVSFSSELWDGDNKTGFFIGPMAEFTLPVVGIGIDVAALYSQAGLKIESTGTGEDGGSVSDKWKSIEVPVNLKWTLGLGKMLGVFLAAGPQFGFNLNNKLDGYETKSCAVTVNVGVGVKLINHLQVGLNYNIGASKIAESLDERIVDNMKKNSWQVSLAYLF